MKRVLVISDPHCGHIAGITPPAWRTGIYEFPHIHDLQSEMWKKVREYARKTKGADMLIINGDAIEGNGWRSAGTETLSTDRFVQCDMFIKFVQIFQVKKIVMTFGTPYHTGDAEDFERYIADRIGAEIHSHAYLKIEDLIFDVRHHMGSSTVPYGRFTQLAKSRTWNVINSVDEAEPLANVYVRGHVHYYGFCGDDQYTAISLPALQSGHTKFGKRRCEGRVNWGMLEFEVDKKDISWKPYIARLEAEKAKVVEL